VRAWFFILSLPLLLGGCGTGTDVGNATNFEVSVGATDDTFSTALSSSSLGEAMLSIRSLGLRPQSDCDRSFSNSGTWKLQKQDVILDYLSNNPSTFNIETRLTKICQIRVVLGPALSGPHLGKSIYFTGVDKNGIPYTIESADFHLLGLKAAAGIQIAGLAQIRSLIYRSQVLADADFSALSENPVTISPDSHPIAFRLFLKQLRKALRGFRLENKSAPNPNPASAPASGDEDLDSVDNLEK